MKYLSTLILLLVPSLVFSEVKTEHVTYQDGKTKLEGVLAYDPELAPNRPGILLVHEWWGRNEYVKRRAKEYASLGYVTFALDMYGKGVLATTPDEAKKLSTPFYQDRQLFKKRVNAGLKILASNPRVNAKKIAALGYCFGGSGVLELARSGADVKGIIVFHGGLASASPDEAKNIKGRVLVLTGADDPFVPATERSAFKAEMDAAKVNYKVIEYPGVQHAFSNPDVDALKIPGAVYNKAADTDSFEKSEEFLKEVLK